MSVLPTKFRYPMMDLAKAWSPLADETRRAVERVLDSGVFVGGEEVADFEDKFARFVHTDYAVGVGSGLDALRLTLRALILLRRLNEGDEIIVPANTYIASVLAVTDAGLTPVLTEPSLATMNLSASYVRKSISPRTRAIMPVHLYGRLCWDEAMDEIVKEHDLIVIEDCAQAVGAECRGKDGSVVGAGALGLAGCFSFYPTKNLGCIGDGGMVVTSDKDLAETVRALANYGSDARYHNIYKGFNSRLDPIQAAVLSVRLQIIDQFNSGRRQRAKIYNENIRNPQIELPSMPMDERESVWHQYVIKTKGTERESFRKQLAAKGVETDVHYPTPLYRQPCYKNSLKGEFPVTELLSRQVVSLPVGNHLTEEDIKEISKIINSTH